MKFMKLGSKPDLFQADGDHIRYVATELATDIVVNVGDVKFYLHKFPLLSKSARLQKLVASANENSSDEIHVHDIPGGPVGFEICVKFCYGMAVTLNAYNVGAARCAGEYLEMYESVDKGNIIYKIEVFLNSSIFRCWKDSIIVLQTTKSLHPWTEELKIVSRCLDSIATKACIDTSKVEWSYTYKRRKLPSENGKDPHTYGARNPLTVPKDWWVEDLCELPMDMYKRVISTITARGVSSDVIAEALNAYASRRLPGFGERTVQSGNISKYKPLAETVIDLLPTERGSVPCGFMLKLLRASNLLECGDSQRTQLMRRIGQQLEEATVSDLLIEAPEGEMTIYDVDIVQSLVQEFFAHEQNTERGGPMDNDFDADNRPTYGSNGPKKMVVTKLIEDYLAEIARDPNLPISKFVNLAEMVLKFPRPSHDGLYRAIDMFLKEHPGICKSEKKRACRLMDCQKLSAEACMHAVQNERLPLRVVVQILFFEQLRQTTSSAGTSTPDTSGSNRDLHPGGSRGSSRSTTSNTEEDWDSTPTADDIKALKGELAALRVGKNTNDTAKTNGEKAAAQKMKGSLSSKIFWKMWSNKERNGEISSSDTSSPASNSAEEVKSTPSRSRRHSVS